jgi:hypothetical protein
MDGLLLLKRVGAVFLVPILLIVGMAFVVAFHDLLVEVFTGIGIDDVFGMDFLVSVLSLLAFIGLCGALYWWVSEGGPGIFD